MTHGIDDWSPIEPQMNVSPEVAGLLAGALDGTNKYTIDHMTIIVQGNGPALHDFVYGLPGQMRLLGAKPGTWKHVKPLNWKVGEVVSLLCLCHMNNGFKSLMPVAVMEITNKPEHAVHQSRKWNMVLVNEGPQALLERGLNGN